MLLELAIGDAYGAGFEYVDKQFIQERNDLSNYVKHPRHNINPGCYTDDTQMSLAIAELIVSGEDWTPLNLANKFVEVFKRDQREGYAGRFYAFLMDVKNGQEFLDKIQPESDKSGAAMRACPIGVFPTISEVTERCRIQAALTHNTPDGIAAALAASLMTHFFIYRLGPKTELGEFLVEHVGGRIPWNKPYHGKVKAKGWMSVQAAVTCVIRHHRLSDLLKDCINYTGDVDTVATIALAAASASEEYVQDLPEHLVWRLENGIYGRNYIVELDKQLMAMVNNAI